MMITTLILPNTFVSFRSRVQPRTRRSAVAEAVKCPPLTRRWFQWHTLNQEFPSIDKAPSA